MFNPDLTIGQKVTNAEIAAIFECASVGTMRKSSETDTLVLITDFTKGIRHDKWIGDVLHFTGYGKTGDQDIHKGQNATLCDSRRYKIDIFLFEILYPGEYTFCGRVELDENPYVEMQPGDDRRERMAWVFPMRPVQEGFFERPAAFVFENMDDYKANGKRAEEEYSKVQDTFKNVKPNANKPAATPSYVYTPVVEEVIEIPDDIVGKLILHKRYGGGVVKEIAGQSIVVNFDKLGEKKLGYAVCIKNKLITVMDI